MKETKPDILELNIPNVCFSIVKELDDDDKRLDEYKSQRLERGFDNTELWNLDLTLARFLIPRLKVFKEMTISYPAECESMDDWYEIIDKIIYSMEMIVKNDILVDKWANQRIQDGCDLLGKYFRNLWD